MKYIGEKLEGIEYKKRPGAYVLLRREEDNKIGIVTDGKGCFFLGGGIEEGESTLQALERELLEEAGYQFNHAVSFDVVGSYLYSNTHGYLEVIAHVFIANFDKKVMEPIELDHKVLWVDPKTYIGKMCRQWQEYILKEYIDSIHSKLNGNISE